VEFCANFIRLRKAAWNLHREKQRPLRQKKDRTVNASTLLDSFAAWCKNLLAVIRSKISLNRRRLLFQPHLNQAQNPGLLASLFQNVGGIYSDQKQGVSRRAAKLAENNKKNRLRIHLFLGVSAPQRENAF
jgi:hypothetical protein